MFSPDFHAASVKTKITPTIIIADPIKYKNNISQTIISLTLTRRLMPTRLYIYTSIYRNAAVSFT